MVETHLAMDQLTARAIYLGMRNDLTRVVTRTRHAQSAWCSIPCAGQSFADWVEQNRIYIIDDGVVRA
jgi:hypothetical protein